MYKKVVVLGGGTGLSYLLKGLKLFPLDLTAIISVADDGRSTGKLRKEFNIPAMGDIRKIIVSMSSTDQTIKDTMAYTFKTTSDLDGHKLGNLILTAIYNMTGSLTESIRHLSKLLDVNGTILPLSEDQLILMGKTINNDIIIGEENITKARCQYKKIYYDKEPHISKDVIDKIKEADLIIYGMGSLNTSLLPTLIPKQVKKALQESKGSKIYICNMMTQPGETDRFTVSDHLKVLAKYIGISNINAVIANNAVINADLAKKYETEEQKDPVIVDEEKIKKMKIELLAENLVMIEDNMIRHNSIKLSNVIFTYLMRDENVVYKDY